MSQRTGSAGEHAGTRAEPVPPLWLNVPARPGQLAGLRRALREWMVQAGIRDPDSTSVLIAVGEAASNAVEHAYLGTEIGLVRLTASLEADVLWIHVIDGGRWRASASHGDGRRGRGFALMRSTMDDVDVQHGVDGTSVCMRLALGRQATDDER